MLYITRREEETESATKVGQEESPQTCCRLPPLAQAAPRPTKEGYLSLEATESCEMECLPAGMAQAKPQTCQSCDPSPMAKGQTRSDKIRETPGGFAKVGFRASGNNTSERRDVPQEKYREGESLCPTLDASLVPRKSDYRS
jgi:hypothetical protein